MWKNKGQWTLAEFFSFFLYTVPCLKHNIAMGNPPFWWYFFRKDGSFPWLCYVSSLEGSHNFTPPNTLTWNPENGPPGIGDSLCEINNVQVPLSLGGVGGVAVPGNGIHSIGKHLTVFSLLKPIEIQQLDRSWKFCTLEPFKTLQIDPESHINIDIIVAACNLPSLVETHHLENN